MEFTKAIETLIEEVRQMVSKMLSQAKFDQTFIGVIQSKYHEGNSSLYTYGVQTSGDIINVRSPKSYDTNTFVRVLIPRGQWNHALIFALNGEDSGGADPGSGGYLYLA